MRMIIKHTVPIYHYPIQSNIKLEGILEDLVVAILNRCAVYKIESLEFKMISRTPYTIETDLVIDLKLSRVIVNPSINYDIILKLISDQWDILEGVLRYGKDY